MDFPDGSDSKNIVCNAGDLGSLSGLGRFPGEVNGYPLHGILQGTETFWLENSMDRGAWWVTVHGVVKVGHN